MQSCSSIAIMAWTTESRWVLIVCVATVFIGLCDRVQISVAIIHMALELEWSLTDQGVVLAAFFYGYTLTQVWGASLGANYGPRRVLSVAMVAWSFLTILTPYMARWSFTLAVLSRVLLGIFEGVTFPCVFAIISPLVSEADRGGAVAWINVGHCLGTVTAFYVCPVLNAAYGWPSSFYLFGSLGLGVAATWAKMRRPIIVKEKSVVELNNGGTHTGLATSVSNSVSKRPFAAMLAMLREPAVAAICFSHFCNNYGSFTVLSWLPTIMSERFDVQGTDLSMACLPYIAAMFGALFGGLLSDRFVAAGLPLNSVRVSMVGVCFSVAAVTLTGITSADNATTALVLFSIERFVSMMGGCGGYECAKFDIATGDDAALLQGMSNTLGSAAGLLGTRLVPVLVSSGGWDSVLEAAAALYVASVVSYALFGDSTATVGTSSQIAKAKTSKLLAT